MQMNTSGHGCPFPSRAAASQQAADEITQSPTAYAGLPKRSVVPGVLLCRVEKGGGRVEEAWEVGEGRGRGEEH